MDTNAPPVASQLLQPLLAAALNLQVTPGSTVPIYKQLVEQVQRMAASGQLKPGAELPSVRELAQTLAVNPMTISKAFGLMEALGLLERRRGLSMVIAQGAAPKTAAARLEQLRPSLERAAVEASQLCVPREQALALYAELLGAQASPATPSPLSEQSQT